MTKEYLKKAIKLNDAINTLKKALVTLDEPKGRLGICQYGRSEELPRSFNKPIKILIKNEITRLEKQLADL